MDMYSIIKYPLSTEKSIRMMESENKLLFVVDKKATRKDVKAAIETMFKAKVMSVRTFIDKTGNKRAYIQFSPETPAIDLATKLGLM